MKRFEYLSFILLPLLLTSCATAITVGKDITAYEVRSKFENPKMDFIGFKIDTNILSTTSSSKISTGVWTRNVDTVMSEFDQAKAIANTKSLRQLGYNLEKNGIAYNKSDSYFGIYSLQEMELYKSNSKYVTFVEVAESKLNYNDNKSTKNILGGLGGGFLGGGLPLLIVGAAYSGDKYVSDLANAYKVMGGIFSVSGAVLTIGALTPTKTDIKFSGLYNIYLYDTETKALIRKESVSVNCSDTFKGSYTYDDSSKEIVQDYISKNIYNELLKKYDELNAWIVSR